MSQVVGIGKVKIGRQIDGLKHLDVFGLLGIVFTDALVRDVHHRHVFYFIDCVMADQGHFSPFRDQDHVVAYGKNRK